jgi:hypothetical protein
VLIMDTLARTKVESLEIRFRDTFNLQNRDSRIRSIATALERCTCITDLRLTFASYDYQLEFFQLLLVRSIPEMVGLKKLELDMDHFHFDQAMFGMVGQCIGWHEGEIEELRLKWTSNSVNLSSIVGLAPALRRLKVFRLYSYGPALTLQQIGELSVVGEDCYALEEFDYNFSRISNEEFMAICQLLSKFPNLKRVTHTPTEGTMHIVDFSQDRAFDHFLEMMKTSKTIEQVPSVRCRNAEEEAAIKEQCHINMIHNQIELIRRNGLLVATVPSCAWPLILKEFSDMSDVLYYLLQQKNGAMIGPTCHGGKRNQDL